MTYIMVKMEIVMHIAIAEAKAKFADLIRRVETGEPVIITRHGRPVVELHAVSGGPKTPLVGAMRGRIGIADDFDEMPADFMASFDGSDQSE